MQGHFPIGAVAKITGISVDTLRAWERRYKAVTPERTERGRQYGAPQINRLSLLNQLVQRRHSIGSIASLSDNELRHLLSQQPAQAAPQPFANLLDGILAAVEDFDDLRAGEELSRLAAVLAPRDVVYQVALPLMNEIGIRWSKGILGVAQEHLVSQLMRNLLGSMMRLFRSSTAPTKMVLATLGGELHEFGILAAAMLASMAGIQPVYLGPNLPAQEIVGAAARTAARVVAIGITVASASTQGEAELIARALPEAVELWVGGRSSNTLDLAALSRGALLLQDLNGFEVECRRVGKLNS